MSIELGRTMRRLRESCELTQKQVAEILNIDRSTYTYYETGHTEPDLKTISRLSKIYNVSAVVFLENSDRTIVPKVADPVTSSAFEEEADSKENTDTIDPYVYSLSDEEKRMILRFRLMTENNRKILLGLAGELSDVKPT